MWTHSESGYDFNGSTSATREVERMMFILAYNHDYSTEEAIDFHAFVEAYAIANRYKVSDVCAYAERCFNDFRSVAGKSSIVGMLARCYNFKEL